MKIENLSKSYNKTEVLNIERQEFKEGKIYAIIGANGCGKSTMLKLMAKSVKSDSKGPVIDFEGKSITYLPQKHYAFKMSTLKNVLLATKSTKETKQKALELMQEMKIDHLAKQQAGSLSGGETSRMALCRAIMANTQILLLDEPTAAMDIESTLLSEELIKKYNKEKNATIIMVTHSINQARRIAHEVIFIKNGKILETGKKEEILQTPQNEETKKFLEFFSADI